MKTTFDSNDEIANTGTIRKYEQNEFYSESQQR